MAANSSNGSKPGSRSGNGTLRFKNGPYLTPKVERIMLQIARGRSASWIAQLYDVREPFVHYVARKTGFPATALPRGEEIETEEIKPDPREIEAEPVW